MKILNLYAGIGGNRKLWGIDNDITVIELDPNIANIYQKHFPGDNVIVADAHQYLLENYRNFDFIWSSVPCPSHSRARYWASHGDKIDIIYPDMSLYQEIILLQTYCKCKWVVENVIPYYKPLIPGQKIGRNLFWSNFNIRHKDFPEADINGGLREDWSKLHGFKITQKEAGKRTDTILRNCVLPELGKHIFDCAMGSIVKEEQMGLFKNR